MPTPRFAQLQRLRYDGMDQTLTLIPSIGCLHAHRRRRNGTKVATMGYLFMRMPSIDKSLLFIASVIWALKELMRNDLSELPFVDSA